MRVRVIDTTDHYNRGFILEDFDPESTLQIVLPTITFDVVECNMASFNSWLVADSNYVALLQRDEE